MPGRRASCRRPSSERVRGGHHGREHDRRRLPDHRRWCRRDGIRRLDPHRDDGHHGHRRPAPSPRWALERRLSVRPAAPAVVELRRELAPARHRHEGRGRPQHGHVRIGVGPGGAEPLRSHHAAAVPPVRARPLLPDEQRIRRRDRHLAALRRDHDHQRQEGRRCHAFEDARSVDPHSRVQRVAGRRVHSLERAAQDGTRPRFLRGDRRRQDRHGRDHLAPRQRRNTGPGPMDHAARRLAASS